MIKICGPPPIRKYIYHIYRKQVSLLSHVDSIFIFTYFFLFNSESKYKSTFLPEYIAFNWRKKLPSIAHHNIYVYVYLHQAENILIDRLRTTALIPNFFICNSIHPFSLLRILAINNYHYQRTEIPRHSSGATLSIILEKNLNIHVWVWVCRIGNLFLMCENIIFKETP